MPDYLVTYHPLIESKAGIHAAAKFGLPPFIDASCRREPDLAHPMPAITALCRGHQFAPRLRMGDRAIYMTIKDRWDDSVREDCWKLVAALQVVDQPPSHVSAATWYRERGLPLPSNLLVEGNPAETWQRTSQRIRPELRDRVGDPDAHPNRTVRLWDAGYHQRAREDPGVSICQVIATSLWSPPTVRVTDFVSLMGKEPSTRNPPRIPPDVADALVAHLHAAGDV